MRIRRRGAAGSGIKRDGSLRFSRLSPRFLRRTRNGAGNWRTEASPFGMRERRKGIVESWFPANKISRGNRRYHGIPCRMNVHKPAVLPITGSARRRDKSGDMPALSRLSLSLNWLRSNARNDNDLRALSLFLTTTAEYFSLNRRSTVIRDSHFEECKDRSTWGLGRHVDALFRTFGLRTRDVRNE